MGIVYSVVFDKEGRHVYRGGNDERIIYNPAGHQLATVGGDMTVRLWDLETHKELFALRLPTQSQHGIPLWDLDFRCTDQGECWIAVPLTMGYLALYRLPYDHPPQSLTSP